MIASQYCIGFLQTITQISHKYTCVPSLLNLLLIPSHCSRVSHSTGLSSLCSNLPFRSDLISRSVMSDSLRPHESQHARLPCPSPTPRVHWDSLAIYFTLLYFHSLWLCRSLDYFTSTAFDCVDHNKLENSSRDGNTRPPDLLLRNLYAGQEATFRTGHGTTEVPNRESSMSRLYIVTLLIKLICRVSTACEVPGWMKHKLESRLPGEISITSDTQMTPCLWQNDENERGEWKSWLKTQHSEN